MHFIYNKRKFRPFFKCHAWDLIKSFFFLFFHDDKKKYIIIVLNRS